MAIGLVPTDGTTFRIVFRAGAGAARSGKNRIHLDLTTTSHRRPARVGREVGRAGRPAHRHRSVPGRTAWRARRPRRQRALRHRAEQPPSAPGRMTGPARRRGSPEPTDHDRRGTVPGSPTVLPPPAGVWGSGDALEGGHDGGDGGRRRRPSPGSPVGPTPTAPTVPLRTTVPAHAAVATAARASSTTRATCTSPPRATTGCGTTTSTAARCASLYDAADFPDPVLNGVDNIIVSAAHDLYVAEDGGNLEAA